MIVMSKKQIKNLVRILVTALIIAVLFAAPVTGVIRLIMWMAAYLIIGYDILIKAFKGIKNRQPLDENLLMSIATVGAIALAIYDKSGDYSEAVAVMLFYQIGEWFQGYAVGKSRKNISELMDIVPDYANIEAEDGGIEQVDPDEVEIGTVILVKPGEKIPIDGIVVDGNSSLDTAALTGESVPVNVKPGSEAVSGCINLNGLLRIKTTKEFGESTASKVLELIEDASSRKSKSENFITRFARVYTPAVVLAALALAVLPPLVKGSPYIPVYHDQRIMLTLRQSVRVLQKDHYLLLFPEIPGPGKNSHRRINTGWLRLGQLWYKASGRALKMYPVHVDYKNHLFKVAAPVWYDPARRFSEQEKERAEKLTAGIRG